MSPWCPNITRLTWDIIYLVTAWPSPGIWISAAAWSPFVWSFLPISNSLPKSYSYIKMWFWSHLLCEISVLYGSGSLLWAPAVVSPRGLGWAPRADILVVNWSTFSWVVQAYFRVTMLLSKSSFSIGLQPYISSYFLSFITLTKDSLSLQDSSKPWFSFFVLYERHLFVKLCLLSLKLARCFPELVQLQEADCGINGFEPGQ